jgi:uncharacterized protein YeaO (DUF488 family)
MGLVSESYADLPEKELAMINLKRAYEPATSTDGIRLLVERLWPRGVKKTSLRIKGWLKDVAPSTELRKWFSHDPAKWDQFRSRYFDELKAKPDAWQPILQAARHAKVTLIYRSHESENNNAVALQEFLQRHKRKKTAIHRLAA